MNYEQRMVAISGTKQLNTPNVLHEEDFYGFSVGEDTIISEIMIDGVNTIDEFTDDASLAFNQGEAFIPPNGRLATGIRFSAGNVVIYKA